MKRLLENGVLAVLLMLALAGAVLSQSPDHGAKIETTYDEVKDKTTVRLAPVKISGDQDKYHSLHMSPSFSYPGRQFQVPSTIDFELQTVVKGKLRIDLYVVFIVDGETTFLSSNRRAVKRPVAGRNWRGERLVFNMPYETLLKIAAAKTLAIKMDAVKFDLGEQQLQAIRDFAKHIQSPNSSFFQRKAIHELPRKGTKKSPACFMDRGSRGSDPSSCCFVYFVDRFLFPNKRD